MKIYYDFHIHTGLSPCGDQDMTPNNIVNMSLLNELDCIAITDHNSYGNVKAVMEVAKQTELLVIPGMEVETTEEIHVVCLFPDWYSIDTFGKIVENRQPKIKNKPDVFGTQLFFDTEDRVIGECEHLLIHATELSIYELVQLADAHAGIAIPAHIDRTSFSVISNLGFIPPDLEIEWVEFSKKANPNQYLAENARLFLKDYRVLQSSDAHYLQDIHERVRYFEFVDDKKPNANDVIQMLRGK